MRFQVSYEGRAVAVPAETFDARSLERELDRVMEELLKLQANDATVGGVLSRGEIEVSVTVEAETLEAALQAGSTLIRAAIHAAGGFTPAWSLDWLTASASRVVEPATT